MEDVYFILETLSLVNLWNYKCCTGICTFLAMGQCSVYRCCVQLFIMIHLVPIMIHKSTGMCIIVASLCCIDILNCISKNLFTLISIAVFSHLITKDLYEQPVEDSFTLHLNTPSCLICKQNCWLKSSEVINYYFRRLSKGAVVTLSSAVDHH